MGKLKVLLVVANLELRRRLSGILSTDLELDVVAEREVRPANSPSAGRKAQAPPSALTMFFS